jgi:hypothetical protein
MNKQHGTYAGVTHRQVQKPVRIVLRDGVLLGNCHEGCPVVLGIHGLGVSRDPHVGISLDGWPPSLSDSLDALRSPRSEPPKVAPAPDFVGALDLQVRHHCLECQQVAVNVGQDCDAH